MSSENKMSDGIRCENFYIENESAIRENFIWKIQRVRESIRKILIQCQLHWHGSALFFCQHNGSTFTSVLGSTWKIEEKRNISRYKSILRIPFFLLFPFLRPLNMKNWIRNVRTVTFWRRPKGITDLLKFHSNAPLQFVLYLHQFVSGKIPL